MEFLTDAGFALLEAAHSAGVLEILLLQMIDLVFTDINMPGEVKGDALAAWMFINHPGIPVLLTSGNVRPTLTSLGRRFTAKPYNLTEVESHIRQLTH